MNNHSRMTAQPSDAYKIVEVPENYAEVINARGLHGVHIGPSEAESPWVPFGDNAAIRHLHRETGNGREAWASLRDEIQSVIAINYPALYLALQALAPKVTPCVSGE